MRAMNATPTTPLSLSFSPPLPAITKQASRRFLKQSGRKHDSGFFAHAIASWPSILSLDSSLDSPVIGAPYAFPFTFFVSHFFHFLRVPSFLGYLTFGFSFGNQGLPTPPPLEAGIPLFFVTFLNFVSGNTS